MLEKRDGGDLIEVDGENIWRVITESTKVDGGWVHTCEEDIMTSTVCLSNRVPKAFNMPLAGNGSVKQMPVPYCPKCEYPPTQGTFHESGKWNITVWDRT